MSPCCIVNLVPSQFTGLVWLRGVTLARLVSECEPKRLHGREPLRMERLRHKWCRCRCRCRWRDIHFSMERLHCCVAGLLLHSDADLRAERISTTVVKCKSSALHCT